MIDTHAHLDGEEFAEDRAEVIARAKEVGVSKVLIPAIDYSSSVAVMQLCAQYPDFAFPMIGLHPEEVKENWREELQKIKSLIPDSSIIGIGEVGLDYYWSREFEKEQLAAFDEQVQWSIETGLPLMIHCRKGQNEMVHLLKQYERELPGGVFHCFTGNEREAAEFLQFDRFVLGIGGVLTFKKSHLPEVLPAAVPLERIVLETDSPYLSPQPYRGKRNEPAYVRATAEFAAMLRGEDAEAFALQTTKNARELYGIPEGV